MLKITSVSFLLAGSFILYSASLALPALVSVSGDPVSTGMTSTYHGYGALLLGWAVVFVGIFSWFANPVYYAALVLVKLNMYKPALFLSLLAFALGLQALMFTSFPSGPIGREIYDSVDHLALGYYVWMASFLLLAMYSQIKLMKSKRIPSVPIA